MVMTVICLRIRRFWHCTMMERPQGPLFLFNQTVSFHIKSLLTGSIPQFENILGGIVDGFEFQMDDDTEVYRSCSATLNGDLFVFGGTSTSNNRKKQVFSSDEFKMQN